MNHNNTIFYEKIIEVVKSRFDNVEGLLLTGSYAKGSPSKKSDVDLMLFSSVIYQPFMEKIEINGMKYDIQFFSSNINNLIKNFFLDVNSRYRAYSNMLEDAVILIDNNSYLKELKAFSKKFALNEYADLSSSEIQTKVKIISNAIEDLEDVSEFGEIFCIQYLIVDKLTSLLLAHKKSSTGWGKNRARTLQKEYPNFYTKLMKSIEDKNLKVFQNIVLEKLEYFGGVQKTYTHKNLPSDYANNKLERYELVFKRFYINESFLSKDVFLIEKFLTKHNVKLLYYYYQNENIVLLLEAGKLIQDFSLKIQDFFQSFYRIHHKNKVTFRKQKLKLIPFVGEKIDKLLEKDLIFLTQLILNKKIFFSSIYELYSFIRTIIEIVFEVDENNMIAFLDFHFFNNLSQTYDLQRNRFNYEELIYERKKSYRQIKEQSDSLSGIEDSKKINYYKIIQEKLLFLRFIKRNLNTEFGDFLIPGYKNKSHFLLDLYLKYIFDLFNSRQMCAIALALKLNYEGDRKISI